MGDVQETKLEIRAAMEGALYGVLNSGLPSAIAPTVYARSRDLPAAMMVAAALIIAIRRRAATTAL
jgi:apolipoprotein N-acyltransferase